MGNKKDEQKLNGNGRVKFRYADSERFFDLDVDNIKNETGVVDGLKSIANALAGRSLPVQRALPAAPKRPTQQVVVEDETPGTSRLLKNRASQYCFSGFGPFSGVFAFGHVGVGAPRAVFAARGDTTTPSGRDRNRNQLA
jgi:hypothetical protein